MATKSAQLRAFIHHFDGNGRRTKPAERVFALLCTGSNPQVLDISIPDKRSTRFKSIQITRTELERVLKSHPKDKNR